MRRTSLLTCAVLILCSGWLVAQNSAATKPGAADFVFPGEKATLDPPLTSALSALTADALGAHMASLSSPGFEGRGLGQPGLDAAVEYVAAMLALRGIPPLAPDPAARPVTAPYFHQVPVREITSPRGQVTVDVRRGDSVESRTFLSGVDCLFDERAPFAWSGGVVFAGYGIREETPQRDDYRGLDVRDRIVVLLGGVPPEPAWQSKALLDRYATKDGDARFAAKAELARSLGARAIIAIEGDTFPAVLAAGVSAPAARYFVPYDMGANQDGPIPVIRVSVAVGDMILAASGLTATSARVASSRALPAVSVAVQTSGNERLVVARNVVAVLRGTDPVLRDQAVVIGAHVDHLGRAVNTIYPGADDNASGTAAVLEIARVLAASPHTLKRSVVFVFWTGEEEGHLGSEYYVRHPLWPLDRTAVYVNLDMIAHPWKLDEIRQLIADTGLDKGAEFLAGVKAEDFFELGVAQSAPDLDTVLKTAARATGVALHLDRTDGKHGGSDYRAFARRDRPFVRFFGNYFDGYHEASDTPDVADPAQVLKMARLACISVWLFADQL
jgi:hypothetical protein